MSQNNNPKDWQNTCPLPCYDCACKGDWCRLLGRNLSAPPKPAVSHNYNGTTAAAALLRRMVGEQ